MNNFLGSLALLFLIFLFSALNELQSIIRCEYQASVSPMVSGMLSLYQTFGSTMQSCVGNPNQQALDLLAVAEKRLSWAIYFTSSVIGSHPISARSYTPFVGIEEEEEMSGEGL